MNNSEDVKRYVWVGNGMCEVPEGKFPIAEYFVKYTDFSTERSLRVEAEDKFNKLQAHHAEMYSKVRLLKGDEVIGDWQDGEKLIDNQAFKKVDNFNVKKSEGGEMKYSHSIQCPNCNSYYAVEFKECPFCKEKIK